VAQPLLVRKEHIRYVEIVIQKEGYKSETIGLERSLDGWMWGNLLPPLFVAGWEIDLITGDGYDLEPEYVGLILKKTGESGQAELVEKGDLGDRQDNKEKEVSDK
jgi:hypothetical protein